MKKNCFICKNSTTSFSLEKGGYKLWRCEKCKLNFVYPQPTKKELQKVYSLDGGYSHSDKGFDKNKISKNYKERIDFLIENNTKNVLDVGCASGAFVYAAKEAGLKAVGIDLDPDSIKFGIKEGLDLRHGRLNNMNFKNNSFDSINLGDILEHVKTPEEFLKTCFKILKKNGVIIISTPNTNAVFPKATLSLYKKFKIMWSHTTPPYHLFDFSDENLSKFLEENNFTVKKITYSKIPIMYSIYHTGYFDKMRKNMESTSKAEVIKGLIKSLDFRILKQLVVSFIYGIVFIVDRLFERKGDQMVVYGVKDERN